MALRKIVLWDRNVIGSYMWNLIRHSHRRVMPVNTYYRYNTRKLERIQPQHYKYFLVLDFEATCDISSFPEMEIIEFPCLKVCSTSFEVLDVFHHYVRPVKHATLTPFCIELTGITQDMVDRAKTFPEVLQLFLQWLKANHLQMNGVEKDGIFVTSGDWDLLTMLPNQCKLLEIPVPAKMTSWINIKKAFLHSAGVFPRGIMDMLHRLELQHEGRLHSGIDDCKNIVKIMDSISKRGYVFQRTRSLLAVS